MECFPIRTDLALESKERIEAEKEESLLKKSLMKFEM